MAAPRRLVLALAVALGCLAVFDCAAAAAVALAGVEDFGDEVSLRIMEGEDAGQHEFPSQVFLLSHIYEPWKGEQAFYRFCVGTIISKKWVLTAAHCVNSSEHTIVSAGSHDVSDRWDSDKPLANRVIVHEKYRLYGRNDNNAADDVALVQVELRLDGRTIAAARLASGEPRQRKGVVAGWGSTRQDSLSEILQKLDVDIIPCPEKTPKAICIRSPEGTGICTGDSGGPLLVDGVLHGVASYLDLADKTVDPNGLCGDARLWAVYMRVASYRRWIRKHSGL